MAGETLDLWLPSQPQSVTALGRYQVILFGDRGTWLWTTCLELLLDSGRPGTVTPPSHSLREKEMISHITASSVVEDHLQDWRWSQFLESHCAYGVSYPADCIWQYRDRGITPKYGWMGHIVFARLPKIGPPIWINVTITLKLMSFCFSNVTANFIFRLCQQQCFFER